jgi:hypothetical protein
VDSCSIARSVWDTPPLALQQHSYIAVALPGLNSILQVYRIYKFWTWILYKTDMLTPRSDMWQQKSNARCQLLMKYYIYLHLPKYIIIAQSKQTETVWLVLIQLHGLVVNTSIAWQRMVHACICSKHAVLNGRMHTFGLIPYLAFSSKSCCKLQSNNHFTAYAMLQMFSHRTSGILGMSLRLMRACMHDEWSHRTSLSFIQLANCCSHAGGLSATCTSLLTDWTTAWHWHMGLTTRAWCQ